MEKLCPLLKKACLEHGCHWYIQLVGTHPNTGEQINEWGCAVAWLPVLQIEQAKEVRQAAAAMESTRNEVVRAADLVAVAVSHVRPALPPAEGARLVGDGRPL